MAVAVFPTTDSSDAPAGWAHAYAPTGHRTLAPRLRTRSPAGGSAIETPQLSVVIVNFCQWRNTARLTRQLRRSEAVRRGAAEVVIVDNRSPADRAARKLSKLSGVSVYLNEENQGFAKAVNRGSKLSRGEWVLLLNPDVTVPPGFLDDVLDAAQRWPALDPRAGVIGFQMRHRDGTKQASSGPFPTLASTLSGLLLPRSRRKCRHQPLVGRRAVPWVTGGCLLVRRDCFEQLGGLDETFFLYYEDVDFCRRVRAAGWSVWYEPDLQVTHHWPLHARQVPPPLRLVTRHALLTYSRKHWPAWQSKVLTGMVWLEAGVRELAAKWRAQSDAGICYGELRRLVADVSRGRTDAAAERIRHAARFLDTIAAAQDGRTE
ncbi:glycosyltransferase family 2 protein [Fimbriiglobus ruber]|uniref:dTDP-Rha:A-D-GlcNAc-diphosphoryl polyprenol, A-3-L-rhamnosyl transferase WbbL n=1 Tax=Fimbriiglobus ruber TaxID=1908690 RepID=A0A225DQK5_9BACT|nr:glycosyltransferase family 2 protein [Fimbriiglobus ruber]OWK43750.1 dTDP-Rha:A-D-GlcNAc-diphosphoryl polyprenol, A-3-L-rhamnosyl transferase WbbL [Fimbriiglobus ruber]